MAAFESFPCEYTNNPLRLLIPSLLGFAGYSHSNHSFPCPPHTFIYPQFTLSLSFPICVNVRKGRKEAVCPSSFNVCDLSYIEVWQTERIVVILMNITWRRELLTSVHHVSHGTIGIVTSWTTNTTTNIFVILRGKKLITLSNEM